MAWPSRKPTWGVCTQLRTVIGGHYGVPYGLANAVILPHVVRLSCPEAESKFCFRFRAERVQQRDPQRSHVRAWLHRLD